LTKDFIDISAGKQVDPQPMDTAPPVVPVVTWPQTARGAYVFRPHRNRGIRILVPGNVNHFFDEKIKNEFLGLFCES
jgi:hypothetical protein